MKLLDDIKALLKPPFESEKDNLKAKNSLLKFFVVLVGGLELLNYHQTGTAIHNHRTELVPAGLDSRVYVGEGYASDGYIRCFVRNIIDLYLSYNPGSARRQFGELLQYFTPESFSTKQAEYKDLADSIERIKVSAQYVISRDIEINQDKKIIVVTGTQRSWVESQAAPPEEKIYLITYKMASGHFQLIDIVEQKKVLSEVKPGERNAKK
jgi:type IV conjugative transfer system protein TraE